MSKQRDAFLESLQDIKSLALSKGPYEHWRISDPKKEHLSSKIVEFTSELSEMVNEASKAARAGYNEESLKILKDAAKVLSKLG